MSGPKNVVLIFFDQWRGDCLSCAGHPVVRTPYLDQLASQGVRFSNAYSAVPSCIAARAALFTGLKQKAHGRVGYRDAVPWNYKTTLAGEFTRQGYQTQAIGKMHVYPERSQMGFQNVILHDGHLHHARSQYRNLRDIDDYIPWLERELGRPADYAEHGLNCNSMVTRPWDKPEHTHPSNYITSQAVDFLGRRDPTKPFFLFLSYHRPHPPFDPPAWAFDMYKDAEMPEPPIGDWQDIVEPHMKQNNYEADAAKHPADVIQRARAGYYGHMTHIDHQVNRFVESLHEHGLSEDTWICVSSDHGEMLGDHNMYRKTYAYEGAASIPLILKAPRGAEDLPHNVVCDGVAELRDIMPTLLDCAGLEISEDIEGHSLLDMAKGREKLCREYLHGEHVCLGPNNSMHWITDGKGKYVWWSGTGTEQFFDLENDPQELTDLAKKSGTDLAPWREKLIAELSGREEGFVQAGKLVPNCPIDTVLSHIL